MKLLEVFQAVKEQSLTKSQLEQYHSSLTSLYAEMSLEMADIEKKEAVFFYERTEPDVTDISIKRAWKVTTEGQRQILLSRYLKATEKVLSSIKSRLYNQL